MATTVTGAGAAKTKPRVRRRPGPVATVVDGRVVVREDLVARAEFRRRRANPQVTAHVPPYTSTTELTGPDNVFVGSSTTITGKHEGRNVVVEIVYNLPEWPAALELVQDLR